MITEFRLHNVAHFKRLQRERGLHEGFNKPTRAGEEVDIPALRFRRTLRVFKGDLTERFL